MKQLFITDLDGTFLTPQGTVSPGSAAIISSLSSRGMAITVATARTPATVEPLLADTLTTIPAIVLTGAALWDRSSQSYIATSFFPLQLAIRAWQLCIDLGLRPFVYTLHDDNSTLHTFFCGTPNRIEQQFIDGRTSCPLKKISVTDTPVTPGNRTLLLYAMGPEQAVTTAATRLRQLGCAVSAYPDTYTPGLYLLEVFAPGVSKAAAVLHLKKMLHADHVTVFGDNLNDLPMMEVADTSVAVANAHTQVLQKADIVIGPNSTDAVAGYLDSIR